VITAGSSSIANPTCYFAATPSGESQHPRSIDRVGLGETNPRHRVRVQRIREWRDLKTLDPNSETHTESVRELL